MEILLFDIANISLKIDVLDTLKRSGALDGLTEEEAAEVIAKDYTILATQRDVQNETILMHPMTFEGKDTPSRIFAPVLYYWLIARKERVYDFYFDKKDASKNTATDRSKFQISVPVITDSEVWENDHDYEEMRTKYFFDKSQRFWYKESEVYLLSAYDVYLKVALTSNEYPSKNIAPNTLQSNDDTCILILPELYMRYYVTHKGNVYQTYFSNHDRSKIEKGCVVKIG